MGSTLHYCGKLTLLTLKFPVAQMVGVIDKRALLLEPSDEFQQLVVQSGIVQFGRRRQMNSLTGQ